MFFSFVNITQASVVINEVQISPTEGRFIELYNNNDSSVDLTNWYIQRKTANGIFGSMITKTNFENQSIGPNSYFLISKGDLNNTDMVVDVLTLTESNTIQIKDGEGNVVDKVGWGETNDCNNPCVSNPATGQSISRISSGSFIISNPTPKEVNAGVVMNDSETEPLSTSTTSSKETVSTVKSVDVSKIVTKIIAPKVVTAGIPFDIDHTTTGLKKEKIILGKFVWNFGDGMKKESATSPPFSYVYDYPGDYVLTLSYSDSTFDINPDAKDRLVIKVIPSGVVISSVGTINDSYVEIENNSSYEMSLYKWILKGSIHTFVLPEGIVILPNKKLKLSPRITGFNYDDLSSLSILDTTGQVFATYPDNISHIAKYSSSRNSNINIVKSESLKNNSIDNIPEVINLNDLAASAGSLDSGLNNKILIYLGLAGLIVIGGVSIIFIRRKTDYPDYVDNEISAKDMTIIE